jgi:uncharacterized membrane protein YkvA (DUF1232 family)
VKWIAALTARANVLKRYTLVVYFAARDPRTPLFVRLLALLVAAYALSPIDLIPDFIPIVGLLDDLVLVPLGLALIVRLVPANVMEAARARAEAAVERPISYAAAGCIVVLWLIVLTISGRWAYDILK